MVSCDDWARAVILTLSTVTVTSTSLITDIGVTLIKYLQHCDRVIPSQNIKLNVWPSNILSLFVALNFQIFRDIGLLSPHTLNNSNCSIQSILTSILIGKSFSFIFCECTALAKCCEYFVRVTPLFIGVCDEVDVLIVNSAKMTALAQSSKESCKDILLECGIGAGNRTFTSSSDLPFTLANVSIDTNEFCKPIVNINFSSIVSFALMAIETTVHLRYELFRRCDNREPVSLGVWEVQKELVSGVRFEKTETFNFTFCEYLFCPGCCDYFVTVTALEVTSLMGMSTVTVSNGRIAAIVQERE